MRALAHSLTAKTLAVTGLLAVALAVGFALLVLALGSVRDAGRSALRAQQAVTAGADLQRTVLGLESALGGYVATGSDRFLRPFEAARREYPPQIRRLRRLARGNPRLKVEADRVAGEVADYVNLWALPLRDLARDDRRVARSVIANAQGRRRVARIRTAFTQLSGRVRAEAAAQRRSADDRANLAVALGLAAIPLVLAVLALGGLALRRGIVKPVQRLAGATAVVATGDLTERVRAERADELGDLERAFNAMTASLESSQEELARRARELERSNRELQDYASVTSHDLQGPLVTIGMYADLLVARHGTDEDAKLLASRIRESASGMRRLVRELLAYARLERDAGAREPVPLADAVRDALDNLAGPIAQAGARIEPGPMPVVRGDASRLTQLVQNLLTNAMKFTRDDEPPHVRITGMVVGDDVHVAVHDNGIGFRPGQAEDIFRPFHRLHSTDRYDGTGIGLAVCQKIVGQHGGRIWAEGRPGEGATFHFTLPAAERPPAVAPTLRVAVDGSDARTPTS